MYFHYLHFFTKIKKIAPVYKKLPEGARACLFHSPLQAFVATIIKLKARDGTIFHYCNKHDHDKYNDVNPQKR